MLNDKTIGIVTVYRTENCGSFLQAFVLMNILKQNGYVVKFVCYNNIFSQVYSHCVISLKKIIKLDTRGFILEWKKFLNFKREQKIFPLIPIHNCCKESLSCVIVGSDTIWNIDAPYFYNNIKRYFGGIFTSKKIKTISYAASAGNTGKEAFLSNSDVMSGLRQLDAISVRDSHTQAIVEEVLGEEPIVVCDPTLLWSKEEYNLLIKDKEKIKDAPILIYYFGIIPTNIIEKILWLKNMTGKRVVSFGENRSWCDQTVAYDPFTFLQYYRDSSFVITNTFHGTIFSLIYQKKFADYAIGKKKVEDILYAFGIEERLLSNNADLILLYQKEINYVFVESKIQDMKRDSLKYLEDQLAMKVGNNYAK